MDRMYSPFPDAPPDTWRNAIATVAERLKVMSDKDLLETRGTDMVLRNLVAEQLGISRCTPDGHNYGHRILDVSWG